MGIDLSAVQLLIRAKKNGVAFTRMATLGRQGLHANRPALISVLRNAGYDLSRELERKLLDPGTVYADEFFRLLGATQITAIDASDYEGAQVVHDMNFPIGESLAASFDCVVDGGTLEHVFNFPTGIQNAMKMVAPGGQLICLTMSNNFCGHGFYQFSPELFYRLLCQDNGFAMESCVIWEEMAGTRFYQVPDPDSTGMRIQLTSRSGMYLFVQAKRVSLSTTRDFVPQQSDYVRHWSAADGSATITSGKGLRSRLKKVEMLRTAVFFMRNLRHSATLRPRFVEAEYRKTRRLNRNTLGHLRPIEELRVKL